jgi:hypothetical protein
MSVPVPAPSPAEFMATVPRAATLPNGNTAMAAMIARELRDIIIRQADRDPRSMQSWLGPSELGSECDREVAGKMARVPRTNHVADPWASIVGRSVHAWLAEHFGRENMLDQYPRWVTEQRVTPDPMHPGTADLYDAARRCLLDWKVLGPTSMAKVRRPEGPPARYVIQLLLYARGYRNLGLTVDRVALVALPRTEPTLDAMYVWEHQCGAVDDVIIDHIMHRTAERRLIAADVMAGRRTIESVPITPSDDGCYWCPFYRPESARDGGPGCPGHSPSQVPPQ